MVYRFMMWWRKIRHLLSRSEWVVRLLSLTRSPENCAEPGLILIQIDGLSRSQMEQAMQSGRLPFVQSLLQKGYQTQSFYSGMPSSTPAVQAELLYGVRCAVPGFGFRDHETGEAASMFNPQDARRVQQRIAPLGKGLLEGGAAYSDIYTGGASFANFCTTEMGFGNHLKKTNWLTKLLLPVLYSAIFIRAGVLICVECVIALGDFSRGLIKYWELFKEFQFIPSRVMISILLREFVTAGVIIDATRGLPIIHCNFLGYDEQAHRRGPSSRFAHWTLKGIDGCLKRIWQGAKRSQCRDYDIWFYSDHGQEDTTPLSEEYTYNVHDVVRRLLYQEGLTDGDMRLQSHGIQLLRKQLLGGKPASQAAETRPNKNLHFEISAKGPVAHVYLSQKLEAEERNRLGTDLVEQAHIPVVIASDGEGQAIAWTPDGRFRLPGETAQVVGAHHPFLDELRQDLIDFAHHPDSGTFLLSGWGTAVAENPLTFPIEHGSHAGFGLEETHGFCLLPQDAPVSEDPPYFRPSDIRQAVLSFLRRELPSQEGNVPTPPPSQERSSVEDCPESFQKRRPAVRIITYNIHSCRCLDGRLSPERFSRIISSYEPDIVALQEVDVGRSRTDGIDQARQIAQDVNMDHHFHPSFTVKEEQYGNAVLSALPVRLVKTGTLPEHPGLEPRGVLWVEIEHDGRTLQLLNTHLGLRIQEQKIQVRHLLSREWLEHPDCQYPVVLCGDFNAFPRSLPYRMMTQPLRDARRVFEKKVFSRTYMGFLQLDYLFLSPGIRVTHYDVPRSYLTRTASDHLPLIVDIEF